MDNNDSTKPQQTGGLKLMTVFIAVLALHVFVIGGITVYHLMGSSGGSDADLTSDKTHKLKADGTAITDTAAPDAAADKSTDAMTAAPAPVEAAGTATTPAAPASTVASSTPAPAAVATAATAPDVSPTAMATAQANPPVSPQPIENIPATPASSPASGPIVISNDDMAQTSTIPGGLAPPPDQTAVTVAAAPEPVAPPVTPEAPIVAPAPDVTQIPASAPATASVSASAPSGPITPAGNVVSGPVRMPAIAPNPAETHAIASTEEHAPKIMHESKKELYTVKITDSYKKIAHAHHITVAELKEVNHIKGDTLHAGQRLIIPAAKNLVAKSEPALDSSMAGATVSTASLSASPETNATAHHHHYYTVAKGDTLKKIAKKFNLTSSALKEANNLTDAKLAVGEKLRIPSKEARSAAALATPPVQPSQVETQPAPIAQPVSQPIPPPAPQPTPVASPELANMTF